MIAVAPSGNNNLCHIVTPDHGERPVPTTRLRAGCACYTHGKHAASPQKGARWSDPSHFQCKTRSRFGEFRAMLLLFHYALQGMLVLARKIHHLRHLGLGDLVGENPALPNSM